MRANLFVYRGFDDPWLRELRRAPAATLHAALPRLKRITGPFDIAGEIKIRPVDLYVNDGSHQPGLVLVGDAFSTSCPVAGSTGMKSSASSIPGRRKGVGSGVVSCCAALRRAWSGTTPRK